MSYVGWVDEQMKDLRLYEWWAHPRGIVEPWRLPMYARRFREAHTP